MLVNRGLALARLANNVRNGLAQQSIRHSSGEWLYRTPAIPRKQNIIYAEILGGTMWWWILYHLFTEPGHIVGEFPYPDPEKWTDAELGIPPDNE